MQLPVPASHINQIEYVFVALDSLSHVVKTHVFHASIKGVPEDLTSPSEKSQPAVSVKSDIPISKNITDGFATSEPIFTVVSSKKRYGLQVALYDMSQNPDYGYGFFGGFEIDLNTQYIHLFEDSGPSRLVSSGTRMLLVQRDCHR